MKAFYFRRVFNLLYTGRNESSPYVGGVAAALCGHLSFVSVSSGVAE